MKKSLAVILSGALLMGACTGCGEQEQNVTEANLPYGGTMITDTESYEVPISYDRRYFNPEQVEALAKYFTALEQEDVSLLEQTMPSIYLDFVAESMFGGMYGTETLLADMNNNYAVKENEPYEITKLEITDLNPEHSEGTTLNDLYFMLKELSGDANYYDHIGEGAFLRYDIQTTTGGESKTFTSQRLFLIQIDGQYYVCS